MTNVHAIGLGEPEPIGKKSLFQPPQKESALPKEQPGSRGVARRRIRATVEFTSQALAVIQEEQSRHRMQTGRVLPLWKLVSRMVEWYGKAQKENGQGMEKPYSSDS